MSERWCGHNGVRTLGRLPEELEVYEREMWYDQVENRRHVDNAHTSV